MGIEVGLGLGLASLAVGTYTQVKSQQQARKAASAQKNAQKQQEASIAEQQATQAMQRDQERRQQVRENRIKVAQMLQSSENTGTGYSSGEAGGVSSLNSQMNTNLGFISGAAMHTDAASSYNQKASDLWFRATEYQNSANQWQSWGRLGQSALSLGGDIYNSYNKAGTPDKVAVPKASSPSTSTQYYHKYASY